MDRTKLARKTTLSAFATLLVFAGTTSAASASAAPQHVDAATAKAQTVALRVMSYNIHHGYPNGRDLGEGDPDLEGIADAIRAQSPDIVAIQEINNRHHLGECVNQPETLARLLAMNVVFKNNRPPTDPKDCRDQPRQAGNAVLSRFPVTDSGYISLPRDPDVEGAHRGLMWAVLDVNGTSVWVYNTHLAAGRGTPPAELRQRQAKRILAEIGPIKGRPTLLAGDLNAKPPGRVAHWIRLHGFVDTSGVIRVGATFPADDPRTRIDYVFASPAFDAVDGHVPATEASDHRPVVMDLRMSTTPIHESATVDAGLRGNAGWATLEVSDDRRVRLTVCDTSPGGWGVVAYGGDRYRGEQFIQGTDSNSSAGCKTYTGRAFSYRWIAVRACVYRGDRVKDCHKQMLFDRTYAGTRRKAGRADVRIHRNQVRLRVCDAKADGWGVEAEVYNPGTGERVVTKRAGGRCTHNVRVGSWSMSSRRLAIEVCKYRGGDRRGCRSRRLAY